MPYPDDIYSSLPVGDRDWISVFGEPLENHLARAFRSQEKKIARLEAQIQTLRAELAAMSVALNAAVGAKRPKTGRV
jgi:hypothetical protein